MVRICDFYFICIICVFKEWLIYGIDIVYMEDNYNLGMCIGMLLK